MLLNSGLQRYGILPYKEEIFGVALFPVMKMRFGHEDTKAQ